TPFGISGSAVQTLKITFVAKGAGSGALTLSDASVIASDGSGTDILSKTVDGIFSVVAKKEKPSIPISVAEEAGIPAPIPITREPVPTGKLPVEPKSVVQLYPDSGRWYSIISPFSAGWVLPADITGISTAINRQPNFVPAQKSEGLFENKTFPILSDGIWYLHSRFQNDIGWGPAEHYRLAVDTQPPVGFEISIIEGEKTDNPSPTITFDTSDALSGLKEYQIRVGDGDVIKIPADEFKGSYKLPMQAPGSKQIRVRALDNAGNGIESSLTLEILPIASPVITFVTPELFSEDEKGLTAKGSALPSVDVLLKVYRGDALVADKMVHSDEKGNWELTFDQPLRNGDHKVVAQSRDERGALSWPVDSQIIKVKSKPIVQIGSLELGRGSAFAFLILIIVIGFAGGFFFFKKRQDKIDMRVSVAASETDKIFKILLTDVENLRKTAKTPETIDDEYALKRLEENIKKMEAYIKRGVEKISK
ncbi:hypothetical protein HY249_02080, partial [Candidatus Azambacteria bacterium]|nr:hypothetical protein [Candidatus Azambacteria bacterium]